MSANIQFFPIQKTDKPYPPQKNSQFKENYCKLFTRSTNTIHKKTKKNFSNSIFNLARTPEWLTTFFTEKSSVEVSKLEMIIESVLHSSTLKSLVEKRFHAGARFLGWTTCGSKGYTLAHTGDICLGQTHGQESLTLGYECINSSHKKLYEAIGKKYAAKETNEQHRAEFAQEILGVEAKAMYTKCKLASELNITHHVKDYYMSIYYNENFSEEQKIYNLKRLMIKNGKVHSTKPAYAFYKNERYDDIIAYYRKQTNL